MLKRCLQLSIACLIAAVNAGVAKAQYMDLSHIVQANVQFNQMMDQWVWQKSLEIARWHRLTGTPIPVNGMTISAANQRAQQAFDAYNRQWHVNSNLRSKAIEKYCNEAILGNGPYVGPNGQRYNLPWGPNHYHLNRYGEAVPGYNPHRMNLNPYYGR